MCPRLRPYRLPCDPATPKMIPTDNTGRPLHRILVLGAYGAAIVVGLKYGYDFGAQISGTILGIVLAINGALSCSIVVGIVVERVRLMLDARTTQRDPPGA